MAIFYRQANKILNVELKHKEWENRKVEDKEKFKKRFLMFIIKRINTWNGRERSEMAKEKPR